MTTARDIMTTDTECAQTTDTLVDAARKMRDLEVGGLPICGEDHRLEGMLPEWPKQPPSAASSAPGNEDADYRPPRTGRGRGCCRSRGRIPGAPEVPCSGRA